jgi:hypothetical protein
MEIPDDLFPGFKEHAGPVLVYVKNGVVERGFPLRKDEFVTSLRSLDEARKKAGLPPCQDKISYINHGPEQPFLPVAVPRRETDGAEATYSKVVLSYTGYHQRWCFRLSVAPRRCDMSKSKTKAEKPS